MKHAVQVTVLGQQYTVKTAADPCEVRKVAAFVNERVAEVTLGNKVVDTLNIAVLALMNLAGAHLRMQEEMAEDQGMQGRLEGLIRRLDDVCPESCSAGSGSPPGSEES
ncbi:cell division protein ZapA [Desulfuromonas soudanensis]|uniref:Cell division protein ZapA n=1 Tax=Desulfuromonas soudanensis TaxID=1603606 RepID=A0A0M4D304_9BACT|nr:cell division protein ZapA [Desulfuromonas soudanensis]ALC17471.1 cell division protein ZapA [Desulfuromonas soudanensis]